MYEFLTLYLLVNPFEKTPSEKEEDILEMLDDGYGWNQIMKECHVSPNTISDVKKKYFGIEASKSASQISKETHALKLFGEGKSLFQVATELDIDADKFSSFSCSVVVCNFITCMEVGLNKGTRLVCGWSAVNQI